MKFRKGFTLIELLVVVSIISLLSTIIISSLNQARQKARDAKDIAAVNQIQKALELYHLDHDKYPSAPEMYYYAFSDDSLECGHVHPSSPEGTWCDLENLLSPYMEELPRSSRNIAREFLYKSDGEKYGLAFTPFYSPSDLTNDDGGVYSNRYEVGGIRNCSNWMAWSGAICL